MEWTPHYISWSVDGLEMRHIDLHDPAVSQMHKAQSLRMNFWTPTFHSWGAGFDPADMPWFVLYDYVEVFTYDERHNEFKFHWRDDFNHFDSGKWHKAAGGFESNTSTFHPDNAYTTNGNLVLKMEPEHDFHHDIALDTKTRERFGLDLDGRRGAREMVRGRYPAKYARQEEFDRDAGYYQAFHPFGNEVSNTHHDYNNDSADNGHYYGRDGDYVDKYYRHKKHHDEYEDLGDYYNLREHLPAYYESHYDRHQAKKDRKRSKKQHKRYYEQRYEQ